jgi:hypothetical protein
VQTSSILSVVSALNAAKVRYLIVGGLAVVAHGYVRLTMDLDIVLAMDSDNVRRAVDALAALGYQPRVPVKAADLADPNIRSQWVNQKGMVVFSLISPRHERTPVDIFVTEPFEFDGEYPQAQWFEVGAGVKAPFVRLERLIDMKRRCARPQDILDVQYLQRSKEV